MFGPHKTINLPFKTPGGGGIIDQGYYKISKGTWVMGIHVEVVSRENHKVVCKNGRFHRYLNWVQQMNTADM
jgi:hypothetical protein